MLRNIIGDARNLDQQRKTQQTARIEQQKAQAQMERERTEEATRLEEEHQRQEAQRKQEAAEEARRLAEDEFRRKQERSREQARLDREAAEKARELAEDQSRRNQEQLREQARLDREAAEKARELAEREEPKIAEVTKEAEEARRARAAAEQRLAEIRSRMEAAEEREALSPPDRTTFSYTADDFAAAFKKAAGESKFDTLRADKKDCYALNKRGINCTFDVTGVLVLEMTSDNPNGRARKIGLVGAIAKDDPLTVLNFMTSCLLVVNLTLPQLSREESSELVMGMIKEASNKTKAIERRVDDVLYSLSVGTFASLSATLQ